MLAWASGVAAQSALDMKSAVFVERVAREDGRAIRSLVPARRISPGDRVVTLVEWRAESDRGPTIVTAQVPEALAFEGSSHDRFLEVSPDGRRWGRLGTMRVGERLVLVEDVTALRWRMPARSRTSRVTYSAIVR